jgi:cytoplasmic tRNA 2-thiolation protein 1
MDKLTRRALLRALAGGALSTVGTVVLARTSLAALGTPEDANPTDLDVQARAAGLDDVGLGSAGGAHAQFINFPGGGFGNGGFRNGGFGNGGGFRNGGFGNGGFGNGGFRNGGFGNGGGFRNGGFRNW